MDSYFDLLNRLLKDACFVGFNLNRAIKYRALPNKLSLYASVKTLANFVIDCPKVMAHVPYMKWTPNPYGGVVVFPAQNVLGETLTLKKTIAWFGKLVPPPSLALSENKIEALGISYDSFLKHCSIQELQLSDDLMELYSKFTLYELNVLATNRTANYALVCVKYNLGMWRNNFQKFLGGLRKSIDVGDLVILQNALEKNLRLAAKAAILIPEKIENYYNKNPIIKTKLLQLSNDIPLGYDLSKMIEFSKSEDLNLINKDGSKAIVLCNLALFTFSLMGKTEDLREDKTQGIKDYFNQLIQLSGLSEQDLKINDYCKAIEKENLDVIWECLNFYFRILKEKSKHVHD